MLPLTFDGTVTPVGCHGNGDTALHRTDESFPDRGWSIEDGCIKNAKNNGRPGSGGGDIITAEQFTDFDFRFEWKIASGGNSGIKYFISRARYGRQS